MDRSYRYKISGLLVIACLAAGCSSSPINKLGNTGPLTPLPENLLPQDPEDHVLSAAITEFLEETKSPLFTRYSFSRVDLDNDGRRDALVMMEGPHHYWCNMDGCKLFVFKAENDFFRLASEIFPVRGPFYVSENTSEGWRDMVLRVSGQSYAPAKTVTLRFDGQNYPFNPVLEPGVEISSAMHGVRVFP